MFCVHNLQIEAKDKHSPCCLPANSSIAKLLCFLAIVVALVNTNYTYANPTNEVNATVTPTNEANTTVKPTNEVNATTTSTSKVNATVTPKALSKEAVAKYTKEAKECLEAVQSNSAHALQIWY